MKLYQLTEDCGFLIYPGTFDLPGSRFQEETGPFNFTPNSSILYRKSGNFGHGFILAYFKYEVPKLNTPKYVTLQKLTAKIEHCLNIFFYPAMTAFTD